MRILSIPRRFVRKEWGGTETVVLETGKRLLALGHDTSIWTSTIFSRLPEEVMEGVPILRFAYSYPVLGLTAEGRNQLDMKGGNLFSLGLMRALRKEKRIDLIHLHTMGRLGGIARREALRRGIPYVVSLHGGFLDVPQSQKDDLAAPLKNTLEWGKVLGLWVGSKRVLQDAAAILCVSRAEKAKIQARFPEKKVLFLPNGVDCARFSQGDGPRFRKKWNIPLHARVLLLVGRIDPQKNQMAAVGLLERLRKGFPRLQLVLAGPVTDPRYGGRLRTAIRERGLEESVTLIEGLPPDSPDLVDAYHAADLFLLSSIHEPFGIVILEAWAAGLPVVAARVGGIPSFVDEKTDALLFNPGDEEALTACVRECLESPSTARSLGEAGRRKARAEYDWDRVTRHLIEVYEGVVRDSGRRPMTMQGKRG
ncbi:MAG: glycosyltransferase family 4 protein [Planctomycetota bacterium]